MFRVRVSIIREVKVRVKFALLSHNAGSLLDLICLCVTKTEKQRFLIARQSAKFVMKTI